MCYFPAGNNEAVVLVLILKPRCYSLRLNFDTRVSTQAGPNSPPIFLSAENSPPKFGYPNHTPKINTAIKLPAVKFQRIMTPTAGSS